MTAHYRHLALAQVQAGMVLSDELLDAQGQVLLPRGAVLSEAMLARMPRYGIAMLPILRESNEISEISEEEQALARARLQQRLAHLFRKNRPEDEHDWASGLLRRYVEDYRMGQKEAE